MHDVGKQIVGIFSYTLYDLQLRKARDHDYDDELDFHDISKKTGETSGGNAIAIKFILPSTDISKKEII